jgi:hypothetical protein
VHWAFHKVLIWLSVEQGAKEKHKRVLSCKIGVSYEESSESTGTIRTSLSVPVEKCGLIASTVYAIIIMGKSGKPAEV